MASNRRCRLSRWISTIDGAIKKLVQSGRVAGTLVNLGNVERYTWSEAPSL